MFERFTDRARHALVEAEEEARRLGQDFIAPEHLLLALTKGDGVAARALSACGVRADHLRRELWGDAPRRERGRAPRRLPMTPSVKKVLERSLREALQLGHNYIGTEHVLLGLLTVGPSKDREVSMVELLQRLGLDPELVRAKTRQLMPAAAKNSRGDEAVLHSPALDQALRRVTEENDSLPVTTGQLLQAMLADPRSQAAQALGALGVTEAAIEAELAAIPLLATSDAVGPRTVQITLGEQMTTIEDPELVQQLLALDAEELRAALRQALAGEPPNGQDGEAAAS